MATSSAALFKPSTDNFGHLTLHATILGDGIVTPENRKARMNVLSLLLFVMTMILAVLALYTVDKTVFAQHDNPVGSYAMLPDDTN